jgi:tRNA-dihydrouridine synthase
VKASEAFDKYGVDGIMIGRAAVGRPWLFGHIRHYLENGELLPNPTVTEKVEIAKLQFRKSLEIKSEPVGIYEMRRHFSNYFKGLPHFREMRLKLLTSLDVEELFLLLDRIREKYGEYRPEVVGSFWDDPDQG